MGNEKRLAIFLFMILPTCLLSRAFGCLTRIPLPGFLLRPIIGWYCGHYPVKTDEILVPEKGFRTFDEFFTRQLRKGVHKIEPDDMAIVSPVDARVDEYGDIRGTTLIQAKGVEYSMADLVPSNYHRHFTDGSFITLYLSPADYHRIHSPVSGKIAGYFILPGRLLTVQEYMVRGYRGLFNVNERSISYIASVRGPVAVCKIGAMNVGRITLSYCDAVTNRAFGRRTEYFYPTSGMPPIEKGQELGTFHLGSTVILLFPKGSIRFEKLSRGSRVRVGQRIARYRQAFPLREKN